MRTTYKDPLTLEIDRYLESTYSDSRVGVIYEKVEEWGEPEPGPSIYDIGLPDPIVRVLEKRGVRNLYRFQFEAFKHIVEGCNVVISAGTGTGKTEAFFLPIAKTILERSPPKPFSILLYPTKALARDQVKRFAEYLIYGKLTTGIYDGDTPENIRRKIGANPPSILVTNPDMIHVGLVYSPYIQNFVKTANTLVFDELHVYDGVLGAHIHHLMRRVKLAKGREFQVVASSATIGNPREFAEDLFDEDFIEVRGPPYRRGTAVHLFVGSGFMSKWSVALSIARFLAENNKRFILFVDSQQLAEILASTLITKLNVKASVHRAGLPHEHRRDVEHKLRDGLLDGVVATPTLELGIDIGVLDAVIMATLPPSYAKYIQRAGRAGRKRKGYVITVLGNDPIDAYYTRNPEKYFQQRLPPATVEPNNEEVSKTHFVAYLLQAGRARTSALPPPWRSVLGDLTTESVVKVLGAHVLPLYRAARRYFSERQSIRSYSDVVEIVDEISADIIGFRELPVAIVELYPGAVYYHAAKPYMVVRLDLEQKRAYVKRVGEYVEYFTRPLYQVDVVDYVVYDERLTDWKVPVSYAKVLLAEVVHGYVVKSVESGETIMINELETPVEYRYTTRATLLKLPGADALDFASAAEAFHAIEHALISAAGITCGAGLTDLGGISYPSGDIVIYDSAVGGSGLAKLLYSKLESALEVAYEILSGCSCEDGCPLCIYSPFCGNNNKVLSRRKGLFVMERLRKRMMETLPRPLADRHGRPIV